MRELVQGTCLLVVVAVAGYSQSFEVATVKLLPSTERRNGADIKTSPGNLSMRSVPMPAILMWAFKVGRGQVMNPEAVSGGDFYEIVAKAAGPVTSDEMRIMLQALLVDRFKLKTHRETKEMSAYALVEAKGGHKLKEAAMADGVGVLPVQGPNKMALSGQSATLDQLAMFLSGPLRAPVVDMTGLKGRYDFEFDLTNFVPNEGKERAEGEPPLDPVAILQLALPKQLGLKLEGRKMPIEMLVIDHIERVPAEN